MSASIAITASKKMRSPTKLTALLLLLMALAGCGAQQITVKGEYPRPLIQSLPFKLTLVLTPEFKQHKYQYRPENTRDSALIMDTGQSQSKMLQTVLSAMFEKVNILEQPPEAGTDTSTNLILVPSVTEILHATPDHTKINVFEIWVKYRFQLFSPEGETIADWYMSAYGKTPSQFMDSAKESINLAAVIAFRDAGANFSLNFSRIPEVKLWLDDNISDGANP